MHLSSFASEVISENVVIVRMERLRSLKNLDFSNNSDSEEDPDDLLDEIDSWYWERGRPEHVATFNAASEENWSSVFHLGTSGHLISRHFCGCSLFVVVRKPWDEPSKLV